MNKTIWTLWFQGLESAPPLVKSCIGSWIEKNPTWTVRVLTAETIRHYVDIDYAVNLNEQKVTPASLSNLVRILLLERYGGVWVDATVFCNHPLNRWLPEVTPTGFFAFDRQSDVNMISSWFLASTAGHQISTTWAEGCITYWRDRKEADYYHWFHRTFEQCHTDHKQFAQDWGQVPKISADYAHVLQTDGRMYLPASLVQQQVDPNIPVFKLTYRLDEVRLKSDSLLRYWLDSSRSRMYFGAHIESDIGHVCVKCLQSQNFLKQVISRKILEQLKIKQLTGGVLSISLPNSDIDLTPMLLQTPSRIVRNPSQEIVIRTNKSSVVSTPKDAYLVDILAIMDCKLKAQKLVNSLQADCRTLVTDNLEVAILGIALDADVILDLRTADKHSMTEVLKQLFKEMEPGLFHSCDRCQIGHFRADLSGETKIKIINVFQADPHPLAPIAHPSILPAELVVSKPALTAVPQAKILTNINPISLQPYVKTANVIGDCSTNALWTCLDVAICISITADFDTPYFTVFSLFHPTSIGLKNVQFTCTKGDGVLCNQGRLASPNGAAQYWVFSISSAKISTTDFTLRRIASDENASGYGLGNKHFFTTASLEDAIALAQNNTEGLLKNPFNEQAYLAQNHDVMVAVRKGKISAFGHFLRFGIKENRRISLLRFPLSYD